MEQVRKLITAISTGSGVVHKKGKQNTKLIHKKPTLQEVLAALLALKGKKRTSPGVIRKPRHMTLGKLHKKAKLPKVINVNIMKDKKQTSDSGTNPENFERRYTTETPHKTRTPSTPGTIYHGLTERAKKAIDEIYRRSKNKPLFEQKEEKQDFPPIPSDTKVKREKPKYPKKTYRHPTTQMSSEDISEPMLNLDMPPLERIPEGEGEGGYAPLAPHFIKPKQISTPGYITGLTLEQKFVPAKPQ